MQKDIENLRNLVAWMGARRNQPILVVGFIVICILVLIVSTTPNASTSRPTTLSDTETSTSSQGDDEAAKRELKKIDWVKDVYVSPGHMNVGVIRSAKQWNSPMIGNSVCGILRKTGSSITRVRFVDIEEVTYQQKSAQAAEIYLFNCS